MCWVEKNYGIFEFQDNDESALFYGRINKVIDGKLIIDMIMSDGSVEYNYDYEYDIKKIQVITFETDYHLSIRLLWKARMKENYEWNRKYIESWKN